MKDHSQMSDIKQKKSGNLAQFQIERMRNYGTSIALIDAKTRRSYTYADVIDRIQRLASGLKHLGMLQGDVLCILTFNQIDYHVIWYAVNMIGATLQTAVPTYTDDDLSRRFRECQTKYVVTTKDQLQRLRFILKAQIILYDGDGTEECPSFASLLKHGRVTSPAEVDPATYNSILLSSSGTTGLPKHVRLTHENISFSIPIVCENYHLTPGMCSVVPVPIFHHYGIHTCVGVGLYSGLKMVLMDKYDTTTLLQLIQEFKPQIVNTVPTIAIRLVKHPDVRRYGLSSVTCITSASAPLGPGLEEQIMDIFNLKYYGQSYGCTETGRISSNQRDAYKIGSCGIIPSPVKNKIVDPVSEEKLSTNQTGEIRVTGKQVSPGYFANPEATKNAFDSEGYFKTGDLGYLDKDGFLFVVDRLKELIKYKGLQVAPAYLEDILRKHPDIADAAVIGKPDLESGELPKAFVVKQPGTSLTAADVLRFVEDHVAPYMRLRGGVEFIQQIPRTASGKILRRHLREHMTSSKL